ncbi:hypothetical protein DLM77_05165 [Leptospira yasudae]|uniref:YhcG N-terminal domain-containing protein n=1 Tax=Leptospira yasudae TaxID=2202201 RepID=A0ABX9M6E2_9LEPT|nr:hypothetical protein DLM77_05165 [Leptospira yasudae]
MEFKIINEQIKMLLIGILIKNFELLNYRKVGFVVMEKLSQKNEQSFSFENIFFRHVSQSFHNVGSI